MAAAGFHDGLVVLFRDAVFHAGEASGNGRQHLFVGAAQCDRLQELIEGHTRFLFHRSGVGLVNLADTDRIHNDEVIFTHGVGRDALEVVGLDHADAPALHLLEEGAGFDGAHEEDDFDRLDIGAGSDHVHGDGNAGQRRDTEGLDEIFWVRAGGAIGDLLCEVVPLAEFLAHDLDDVVGVGIVLGEDQRLGHPGAAGKDLSEELLLERLDDGADLVRGHHVAVELVGIVGEVVVELFPASGAGLTVALFHIEARIHFGAGLGDGGADAVHVVVHVHAVGHGLLVVVLHDEVLIEEAEGLLVGRGGEPDEGGVEVFEHLRPEVVDGPVAFVGDDDVEGFNGDGRVVLNRLDWASQKAVILRCSGRSAAH